MIAFQQTGPVRPVPDPRESNGACQSGELINLAAAGCAHPVAFEGSIADQSSELGDLSATHLSTSLFYDDFQ